MATKIRQQQIQELLTKAKEIAEDDTMSKQEFLEAFKEVMRIWKELKAQNAKEVQMMKDDLRQGLEDLKVAKSEDVTKIEKRIGVILEKLERQLSNELDFIRDKVRSIKDGKDADENVILDKVLSQIVFPEQKEPTPEEVRDKLETLKEEERLDASAIKGLEDRFERLERRGAMFTGQSPASWTILTATGDKDGSNKDFTFAVKPKMINVNGAFYREDNGWSWGANDTATLDFAPISGSDVYGIS